jgi:hypothetical protein
MKLPIINCPQWTHHGNGFGKCAIGEGGGMPSHGYCKTVCTLGPMLLDPLPPASPQTSKPKCGTCSRATRAKRKPN